LKSVQIRIKKSERFYKMLIKLYKNSKKFRNLHKNFEKLYE